MAENHPDPNCIFCKIIDGQIPCHRVYEDDAVLAFLDVGPLSKGHTLVIPKRHGAKLTDLPEDDAAACMRAISRIAPAVIQASGAQSWNVLQNNGSPAGQVVMHVHFHIIPRSEGDGLGYRWNAGKLANDQGKQLAESIRGGISR